MRTEWTAPPGGADAKPSHSSAQAMWHRRLAIFGVAVIASALTACGPGPGPAPVVEHSPSRAPTLSPSPSVDPAVASATAKATAAYQGYFAAYASAAAKANVDDPSLPHYIGGALLSLSQHNLRQLADHGAVEAGTVSAKVLSTKADLTATPETVTVTACVDYTNYRLIYKATGKTVPNSTLPVKKYTTTATVQLYAGGQWLVSADTPHRDTPC